MYPKNVLRLEKSNWYFLFVLYEAKAVADMSSGYHKKTLKIFVMLRLSQTQFWSTCIFGGRCISERTTWLLFHNKKEKHVNEYSIISSKGGV